MARATNKLTNDRVERFQCRVHTKGPRKGQPKEQDTLWCSELKGFGMRLSRKTNTRTYIFVYRIKDTGREVYITIGRHNDPYRVDQARAKALDLKAQVLSGRDPAQEERNRLVASRAQVAVDAAQSVTLRQVMEHYLEHHRTKYGPLRPASKESVRAQIERNLAAWLDKPMATTITRDACLVRFTEMSDTEENRFGGVGKKTAANLTMTYLGTLCNHARDLYEQEDGTPRIFAVNPVSRMTRVRHLNPKNTRKRRIPKDRVGAVWSLLRHRATHGRYDVIQIAADWVSFVLLTGTRLTESGALRKEDCDMEKRTIRLRGDVVKNHSELVLPMSDPVHAILEHRLAVELPWARGTEYVFPSVGRKQKHMIDARATLDAVSEVAGLHLSMHDLRRTYEDVLRYANVDPDVRRILTNHTGEDVHARHYANDDSDHSLRPAVEAAAQWILEQAAIADGKNVIAFPSRNEKTG